MMNYTDLLLGYSTRELDDARFNTVQNGLAELGFAQFEIKLDGVERIRNIQNKEVYRINIGNNISNNKLVLENLFADGFRNFRCGLTEWRYLEQFFSCIDSEICLSLSLDLHCDKRTHRDINKIIDHPFVKTLILWDRQGMLDPWETKRSVAQWGSLQTGKRLAYQGNNDNGLAVANAMAAKQSGVTELMCSVSGVDSSVSWEEVLLIENELETSDSKNKNNYPNLLVQRCKSILELCKVEIQMNKPVLGKTIFFHESGIHVDGIQKNCSLYEPYLPQSIGQTRRFVLGKTSGRAAIELWAKRAGQELDEEKVRELLDTIKRKCCEQGHGIALHQLNLML